MRIDITILNGLFPKPTQHLKKKKQEVNQRHKDRPTLRHLLMKYIKLPGRLKII